MRLKITIGLLLAGITLALYWPVRNFDLVQYDDPQFLTENPEIQSGLNGHSLAWAMGGVVAANWHPVTTLSFVLGHQFWGLNPGAEHLVNAGFHALNAALLFLVLLCLTQSTWRSAVVAALFAWHPLRVESVAWIAERKDVLSVFFMLLTLWAYARYAQRVTRGHMQVTGTKAISPTSGSSPVTRHPSLLYWLALFFFALGLMSKAMLVTLPFLLLLLDVWPLGRVTSDLWRVPCGKNKKPARSMVTPSTLNSQLSTLFLEKWPFFALAAAFSIITFLVQRGASAAPSWIAGSGASAGKHLMSYLRYLGWKVRGQQPGGILSISLRQPFLFRPVARLGNLGGRIDSGPLISSRLPPAAGTGNLYLAVGWFWYLGTMVPAIGFVQVGSQGMADRTTYIPLIGPVISLVWLLSDKWGSKLFPGRCCQSWPRSFWPQASGKPGVSFNSGKIRTASSEEQEDHAEHADNLDEERVQFAEVTDFQRQVPGGDDRFQARPGGWQVGGVVQLQGDGGDLVGASAVDQLLRQWQRHGDVVVVEFLDRLDVDAGNLETDDIGGAVGGGGQQVDRRGAGAGGVAALLGVRKVGKTGVERRGGADGNGLRWGRGAVRHMQRGAKSQHAGDAADQSRRAERWRRSGGRPAGRCGRRRSRSTGACAAGRCQRGRRRRRFSTR